ncbi:Outer membrane efflux protein [Halanaerobium congolense]|jgi:outer membrane protein TolC|uniref:Outer membrane efflux protein n=1 Tax=Halanaerobium congolense TaxID=54121 RepID=A0A1G8M1G0_9FIRM|nr:TolC family protein [Halanaerobium congolense]KXS49924.1 MAG: outer membrane efflux protein [Halanaerobium sp. T82-1]TDX41787.1 outer membrane efflux protein [Halanaerobium congolense]SDI61743.1 Outer membrane efflux protein [Halanaerobium congolense]SET34221.1 Outer membrane efflux protein [Halanaerobium congolense]
MTEKNFKTMVLSLLILTFFLTISPNAAAEKAAFFEALSREIDNNSNSYTNSFSEQSVYDGSRANLNFKREFLSGAEISQRAILDDQGRENYNFSFSYPLLPGTNSELENQYFELKKEIILAEAEYLKLKDQIIIELSSDYLNLLNQKKEVENLSRTKNDAALALKRAGRKSEINEITKSEMLAAEISFLEAENSYLNSKNEFEKQKDSLEVDLNLTQEESLLLEDRKKLESELKAFVFDYNSYQFEELYEFFIQENSELLAKNINIEILKNELNTKARSDFELNLSGNYDYDEDESILGVSLSYDLFDSGSKKNNIEKIEARLKLTEKEISNQEKELKIELQSMLNQLSNFNRQLQKSELELKKAELDLKEAEEKQKKGIITDKDYLLQEIDFYQKLTQLQDSRDRVLIEKLKLSQALNKGIFKLDKGRRDYE